MSRSFLPPEIIDSGVTGQYHIGPTSRDQTVTMPYALALRNIYTYETFINNKNEKKPPKKVNWGIKKSYINSETEEFELCGIRAWSSREQMADDKKFLLSENSNIIFWRSNFTRIHVTNQSKVTLYYQFSLINIDKSSLTDDQVRFVESLHSKWANHLSPHNSRSSQFSSASDWRSRKKASQLYRDLYSPSFESDIAYLSTMAKKDKPYGLVSIECEILENGHLQREQLGRFRSYLPRTTSGRQEYRNLESPAMRKSKRSRDRNAFRVVFFDYFDKYSKGALPNLEKSKKTSGIPFEPMKGFFTNNPRYQFEISNAVRLLERHFDSASSKRPINCLILGAPGSGKTFIAKTIGAELKEKAKFIRTYNLSHISSPTEIDSIFREIASHNSLIPNLGRIYFFDEFDVTVTGTSIIRYLIDYILEGEFEGVPFGRVAFLFSGGTLADRTTISLLQANAADFDLPRFLFDCFLQQSDPGSKDLINQSLATVARLENIRTESDRSINNLNYLLGLDKLRDFLSRINGFILEIPDIANPLGITSDRMFVDHHALIKQQHSKPLPAETGSSVVEQCSLTSNGTAGPNRKVVELLDFVHSLEASFSIIFPDKTKWGLRFPFLVTEENAAVHVLEYKNMMLCERFDRVCLEVGNWLKTRGFDSCQHKSKIYLDKEHMNFLCTAPLTHGSRSLAYVVSKLEAFSDLNVKLVTRVSGDSAVYFCESPNGNLAKIDPESVFLRLDKSSFSDEAFRMHIGNCTYSDIDQWWTKMFGGSSRKFERILVRNADTPPAG